jgi:hypothetical protein
MIAMIVNRPGYPKSPPIPEAKVFVNEQIAVHLIDVGLCRLVYVSDVQPLDAWRRRSAPVAIAADKVLSSIAQAEIPCSEVVPWPGRTFGL